MSLSNEDTFRAQNSINLSIALVAAAFALMAGVLAAFFAVADKIPETGAGTSITVFTIIAIGLCLVSVFFGGRGVSKTIKAVGTSSNKLPEKYDGGSFGWQG
jgi:predicted membrane channel-forming protein YqfA (hemolysin III family)